jgi:hypothetical protein
VDTQLVGQVRADTQLVGQVRADTQLVGQVSADTETDGKQGSLSIIPFFKIRKVGKMELKETEWGNLWTRKSSFALHRAPLSVSF